MAIDEESLAISLELIKHTLPDFAELIAVVRKAKGFLDLPPQLINFLSKTDTNPWARFYENPLHLKGLSLISVLGTEDYLQLNKEFKEMTQEERKQLVLDFKRSVLEGARVAPSVDALVDAIDMDQEKAEFESLSGEERTKRIEQTSICFYSFIVSIFSFFSVMSFGRTMPSLIKSAKAGDEEALCHAVQVDKTILFAYPEFRQRLIRAQLGKEPEFLNRLATALKGPSLTKKFPNSTLMYFLYLLEDEGFLKDLSNERLLDICEEMGLYGEKHGIYDVDTMRKVRYRYKKLSQGRRN